MDWGITGPSILETEVILGEWVCWSSYHLKSTSFAKKVCCYRARGKKETFIRVSGVLGEAVCSSNSSYRWRSVGVTQHWMEGAGKVVGMVAAVVLLGHRHQTGQANEEQEEQLERECSPEDSQEEGLAL